MMIRSIPNWGWSGAILAICIGGLARCMGGGGRPASVTNPRGEAYTGSAVCARCHLQIAKDYTHTAHAWSSRPAAKQFIKGSFEPGKNVFSFNDHNRLSARVDVRMEQRDSGLFQVAYVNGMPRRVERFGVVMGAGRKAQSYLFWRGNQLLQLPISWFSATSGWANSPGFPTDQVKFNRLIPAHCLECHATAAELLATTDKIPGPNPPAYFDRERIIYGIGCENCHGPGARHVAYQSAHAEDKQAKYIVNPAKLSRQRNLDICAACHSGIRGSLLSPFSFEAGDTLSNYFGPVPAVDTAHAEVHGNQYGLLAASRCFKVSGTIDCRTCHDTHREEKDDMTTYSQRCMSCHSPDAMVNRHGKGADITRNCVDCHMPVQASSIVTLMVPDSQVLVPLFVRNHRIAVYASVKGARH